MTTKRSAARPPQTPPQRGKKGPGQPKQPPPQDSDCDLLQLAEDPGQAKLPPSQDSHCDLANLLEKDSSGDGQVMTPGKESLDLLSGILERQHKSIMELKKNKEALELEVKELKKQCNDEKSAKEKAEKSLQEETHRFNALLEELSKANQQLKKEKVKLRNDVIRNAGPTLDKLKNNVTDVLESYKGNFGKDLLGEAEFQEYLIYSQKQQEGNGINESNTTNQGTPLEMTEE